MSSDDQAGNAEAYEIAHEGKVLPLTPEKQAANSFLSWLQARADTDDQAGEFTDQQVGRIMMAESIGEVWDADEPDTTSSKSIPNVEMVIQSFTVHHGMVDTQSPYKFFFVVRAAKLADGEALTFATGAPLIMAKLKFLDTHENEDGSPGLPVECVIRADLTSKGREVLKLKKIGERPVRGKAE